MSQWQASDDDYARLIDRFERGILAENEWHQAEHLAIAFWYIRHCSLIETVFKMKLGILKYNERYRIQQTLARGYHETITLFFIRLVHRYAEQLSLKDGAERVTEVRPLIAMYPNFLTSLWLYYSRPLLNSVEARIQWTPPDLMPL